MTERERDCVPWPHDLLHAVQRLKALTVQWIGHAPWSQARVSALCGQAAPPLVGCVSVRERRCEPAPHDVVHVVQALKAPTPQSFGQACVLHLRVSALCGQALPPKLGCLVWRSRVAAPVPQDLLHALHLFQLPVLQSIGQTCLLHARVSA